VSGHRDGVDLEELRVELQRTADIRDATEQMLEIAAVVDAALRAIDVRPIVVGGLAVAYWTTGLYLTGDIDVVMPHSAEIEQRLAALGFERDGRFWTLPGREPVFEAPGSILELNPDGHIEVELASGRTIRIQDAEEVLLLRLAEFTMTGNADVFQQSLWLLGVAGLDRERLRRRAADESLAHALDALDQIGNRVEQDATKLELWEITDLAKALRAPAEEP
jgi:hypothetical protein